MPSAKVQQQLPKLGTPSETYDKETIQNNNRVLNSLGITLPKNVLKFTRTSGEILFTTNGDYSVGSMDSDNVYWKGIGSKITTNISLDGLTWQIEGINFQGTISLSATTKCCFTNCRFSNVISIASGGKATFSNCSFENVSACNNAGVAANVGIFGQKTSAVAHTNCTIIFEI